MKEQDRSYKALWNREWGGLPDTLVLSGIDPYLGFVAGIEAGQAAFGDLLAWLKRLMLWPFENLNFKDFVDEAAGKKLCEGAERQMLAGDRGHGCGSGMRVRGSSVRGGRQRMLRKRGGSFPPYGGGRRKWKKERTCYSMAGNRKESGLWNYRDLWSVLLRSEF